MAGLVAAACTAPERAPTEVRLTLLGTTDVHGHLLPYEYATDRPAPSSLAQVATLVDSIRRADRAVLLFDSGDLLQGTPLDEIQAREGMDEVHPVIEAMNFLHYDASAIGNHEFNYGLPFMRSALGGARFPFLAANIYVAGTDSLAFPPYVLRDVEGVRVGVIGFTTPGVAIWDRANVEGQLRFEDIVQAAHRWVPDLREAGAEVLVAIAHSGVGPGSSYGSAAGALEENALERLATEVPELDVIFGGHTAESIDSLRVGRSLILHAGVGADHLAVAHVVVRRGADGLRVVSTAGRAIPTAGVPPFPGLVQVARPAHERTLAWLGEPIGYTPNTWSAATARFEDTPIADLVATVQAEITGAQLSSTAILNTTAGFGPGPITRRDILGLYVYANTLRAVRLSGGDLADYLEHSARYYHSFPGSPLIHDAVPGYDFDMIDGLEYELDLSRPPGERVTSLRFQGQPVADSDSFSIALNSYRHGGGGGFDMIPGAPTTYLDEVGIAMRIVEYVERRDTLRIEDVFESNWRIVPAAAADQLRSDARSESGQSH
jgi:2',3'-cyclic-nucleotide 2'-phosphodiesterase/3'-nucleotidase